MAFYAKVASAIPMTGASNTIQSSNYLTLSAGTFVILFRHSRRLASGLRLARVLIPSLAVCRLTSGVSLEGREVRLLLLARSKNLQRMLYVMMLLMLHNAHGEAPVKDRIPRLYLFQFHVNLGMEVVELAFSCGLNMLTWFFLLHRSMRRSQKGEV